MKTIERTPVDRLKPDPNQPRKHFSEEDLRRLGESLKVRQLLPLLVRPDDTIIDGERRWRAAQLVGLESLDVVVCEGALPESEIRVIQLTTTLQKQDLIPQDHVHACIGLMDLEPHWTRRECAERLGVDPSLLTRWLSYLEVCSEVQMAFDEGSICLTAMYDISKVELTKQPELLTSTLAARQGRQKRPGTIPAAKFTKVQCLLPSGISITVAGKGITLEDSIKALSEAIKEMKQARDDGLNEKTFTAVTRDKANKARKKPTEQGANGQIIAKAGP